MHGSSKPPPVPILVAQSSLCEWLSGPVLGLTPGMAQLFPTWPQWLPYSLHPTERGWRCSPASGNSTSAEQMLTHPPKPNIHWGWGGDVWGHIPNFTGCHFAVSRKLEDASQQAPGPQPCSYLLSAPCDGCQRMPALISSSLITIKWHIR
jgi:hypothetical protein